MSKQASKTLIGGFVLGAVALVVAAVLIFGSGRFLTEKLTYVLKWGFIRAGYELLGGDFR